MRAFIALDLDAPIRKALGRSQDSLRTLAPTLKFVDPASIHLTLKFLGDIDARSVPQIADQLSAIAADVQSFEFAVRDLGCFGDRSQRVRTLWAGVDDSAGELASLQARIESAMDAIGYPPETRPYAPHLTLARSRRPVPLPDVIRYIDAHKAIRFG